MKQLYNQKSSSRLTALTLTLSLTLGLMLLSCSSGNPSNISGGGDPRTLTMTRAGGVDDGDISGYNLAGAKAVTTAVVGSTTYLFVAGYLDDGVSVFSVVEQ